MKRAALVIALVLMTDQALKFWVKLHFHLDEYIPRVPDSKYYLHFIENDGMAFGLKFWGVTGKLLLTFFRIIASFGIGWLLWRAIKLQRGTALILSLSLILAGAVGNIIDSTFYGLIFSESTSSQLATLLPPGGGYGPLFQGAVVDMFYFPLFDGRFPEWFPFWGGEYFQFFRPVFNLADASISVGVALMILTQRKRDAVPPKQVPTNTDALGMDPAAPNLGDGSPSSD